MERTEYVANPFLQQTWGSELHYHLRQRKSYRMRGNLVSELFVSVFITVVQNFKGTLFSDVSKNQQLENFLFILQ